MTDQKISVAIAGWQPKSANLPNLSQHAFRNVSKTPDMEVKYIVSRNPDRVIKDIAGRDDVPSTVQVLGYDEIKNHKNKIDLALLAVPTEHVEETATLFLEQGIVTSDSFDDHHLIIGLRDRLQAVASKNKTVAALSFGWEPGLLSVIRDVVSAVMPGCTLTTTYGGQNGGRSLGHSAMARETIRNILPDTNALSITYAGAAPGHHNRGVIYIDPSPDAEQRKAEVFKALRATDKFTPKYPDEKLDLIAVKDQAELNRHDTNRHSCEVICKDKDGEQTITIMLDLDGPKITTSCMIAAGRAAVRQKAEGFFGAISPVEIIPVDMLPGQTFSERIDHNKKSMI